MCKLWCAVFSLIIEFAFLFSKHFFLWSIKVLILVLSSLSIFSFILYDFEVTSTNWYHEINEVSFSQKNRIVVTKVSPYLRNGCENLKLLFFFFFRVLLIIHTRKPTWVIPYGKGYSSVLWTSVIIISSCWQLVQPKCTDRIARPFQDLTVQSLFFCIMITYVFLTINSQKQNLKKCCTFTFWQKKRKNPFNCWQTILYFSF